MPLLALGKSPGNSPGELKKMVQKVFFARKSKCGKNPIRTHCTTFNYDLPGQKQGSAPIKPPRALYCQGFQSPRLSWP